MPDLPYNENVPGYLAKLQAKVDAPVVATVPASITDRLSAVETGKASATALAAMAATIPAPATAAPPPVQVDSAPGSATPYARADHTHQSRLQARRIQVTPNASGQYVYAFPLAYDAGVVPIVNVTAETPSGQTTYRYDACLVQGATTNAQTTILITKLNTGLVVSILGAALGIFQPVTTAVWINIMSRAPS